MDTEKICYGCFREKIGDVCPFCGFNAQTYERPANALELGTVLKGRYVLGRVIGAGGFGITYLAFDDTLDVVVAVKEYFPSAMATRSTQGNMTITGDSNREACAQGRQRFLAEARVLAKLEHVDGIVHVRDFFEERSTAYFVMDYVEGSTLRETVMNAGGRLAFDRVRDILLPVMGALTLVHAQGLLHRDISPDNIVIRRDGKPCLIDFGAARFTSGGTPLSVVLKPGFAPEEQYSRTGHQGPWSDVYAMAATMYWSITGTLAPDALERLQADRLQPPSKLGVSIPEYAERALMSALAVHEQDRTQSMATFISELLGQTVEPSAASAPAAAVAGMAVPATSMPVGGSAPSASQAVPATSMPASSAAPSPVPEAGQATPAGGRVPPAQVPPSSKVASSSSGLGAWIRTHKVPAALIGVGLAAVVACAIILPITLSGDRGQGTSGSTPSTDLSTVTGTDTDSGGGSSSTTTTETNATTGVSVEMPSGFTVVDNDEDHLYFENAAGDAWFTASLRNLIEIDGRTLAIYDAADFVAQTEKGADWASGTLATSGMTAGDWNEVTVGGKEGYVCMASTSSATYYIAIFDSGLDSGIIMVVGSFVDDPNKEGTDGNAIVKAMDSVQFVSQPTGLSNYVVYTHNTLGCQIMLDEGEFGGTVSIQDGGIGVSPLMDDTDTAAIIMAVPNSAGMDAATAISTMQGVFNQGYAGVMSIDGSAEIYSTEYGRDITTLGHCTAGSGAYDVDFYVTKAGGTDSTMWWSITLVSDAASYEDADAAVSYITSSFRLLSS